jgi:hypothetical protein
MRIGGRTVAGPKTGLLVIPREDGDIVFKFVGVTNDSGFEEICPPPKPPRKHVVKLETTIDDYDDPNYIVKRREWDMAKTEWIFLQSIAPSNIEWDSVKMDDPSTYKNWRDDLKNAGFSINEVNTVYDTFFATNILTDKMLNEARSRFLASQEATAQLPG